MCSCGSPEDEEKCVVIPETNGITVNIQLEQLQDTLANLNSKTQLVELLRRQPVIRDFIFRRHDYPDDSVFLNTIYKRLQNVYIDTLLAETRKVFGDGADLKGQFEEAFKNLKYYYPGVRVPRIQTVISGLDTDMFVS
jgi:hypothetical protein